MPTDTTIIDRLRAEAEWFGSRKWGDTGLKHHGEAAAAAMRDAADALALAAGAPPALVALVQRLQGAERAHEVRRTPATERYYLDALAAVQDWRPEPAPAPVAPPAETPALGVVTFDHEAQRVSYRPAPPAVAGGDAPTGDGRCARCRHYHLDGSSCGFHQCGCKGAEPIRKTPGGQTR